MKFRMSTIDCIKFNTMSNKALHPIRNCILIIVIVQNNAFGRFVLMLLFMRSLNCNYLLIQIYN